METKVIYIENVELVCPVTYHTKHKRLQDFPTCCGAGKGIGDKIVPDSILGLKISAACSIHDHCFENGEATWADFHQSNSMFIRNIFSIISSKSMSGLKFLRIVIAGFYFHAVDTIGSRIYKRIQEAKGLIMR